jgi:hypothetical protein
MPVRRAIAAALSVLALATSASPAAAQTFTPARDELVAARIVDLDLAEAWIAEQLALNPAVAAFELAEQGRVVVTTAAGGHVELFLDSYVDRLGMPPEARGPALAEIEAGIAELIAKLETAPVVQPESILPIVRHEDFLAMALAQVGPEGEPADAPVHAAFAGDAGVLLAYDAPRGIGVMSRRNLGLEEMDDAAAFALAKENLAIKARDLVWRVDGGLRVAILDGVYESSLVLLDEVWTALETDLGAPLAVAIPSRGALVAARADNPDDVARLRAAIEEAALDPFSVSEEIFVREGGGWRVLE